MKWNKLVRVNLEFVELRNRSFWSVCDVNRKGRDQIGRVRPRSPKSPGWEGHAGCVVWKGPSGCKVGARWGGQAAGWGRHLGERWGLERGVGRRCRRERNKQDWPHGAWHIVAAQ